MKVGSIAECNTFDLHEVIIGHENQFLVFFLSGPIGQVLLYAADVTTFLDKNVWQDKDKT